MQKVIVILLGILVCSCAVEDTAKSSKEQNESNVQNPVKIRQRFVPTESAESGQGASWTALASAPDREGALWLRAQAGIGDTFPVKEKDGPKLFDVTVPEGSDDKLLVEVRYQGGIQRIDVPRDAKVTVEIGGSKYEWYYPSLYVNPDSKATTDKAFLILTRLP
jgi:hypothetical protein